MKAIFKEIKFSKPVETKYGLRYQFHVKYDVDGTERIGSFLADEEDQKQFTEGNENEFTETPREYQGRTYYNIKGINKNGNSNFSKKMKNEQARYSGFAMAYSKDLVMHGKQPLADMYDEANKMFDWMVKKDKELANGK